MALHIAVQSADPPRRSSRDVIDAVLDNMRKNLEPLKYSTLAPSRYLIYLHPAEYARIEGIIPLLQKETARALVEELDKLNYRSPMRKYLDRLFGADPAVQNPAVDWQIEFLRDVDGEIQEGDILIDSELLLPGPVEFGAGERTRRVTTMRAGQRTTTRRELLDQPPPATTGTPVARLRYEDNSGAHTFDIVKDSVTIGRGGIAYRVDVRIDASVDVSREHLRIRRDRESGRFFAIDLSSLGTTLDGKRLPKGYDEAGGSKRENGVETQLPDRARLGMAETVYVEFEVLPR